MSFMTDDQLERAIDDAARQLTAGEPTAGFRARVLARVDAHAHRRSGRFRHGASRWWTLVWAGSSLAAVVLILAVYVFDGHTDRDSHEPPATPRVNLQIAPPARPESRDSIAQASTPRRTSRERSVAPGAPDASEIDPLTMPSIEIEPIAIDALSAGSTIDPAKLDPVASIAVAPLGADDQGEPR